MAHRIDQGTLYRPPPLAKFFHALPHVNISLHLVNSTFAPDSDVYLESLGILGSIPALWLILTLFMLLIYLCTRCCDRKPRPKNSIVILKWTLSFFTMLCCGAVGVGLYGNDDVHNGMLELLAAGRAMDETISSVKNQTSAIDSTLKLKVEYLLTQLGDVFDEPVTNQTARAGLLALLEAMTSNTSIALASLQDISRPLRPVTLAPTLDTLHLAEAIRWPVTMAILSILLVFCVILLFGVARHSRCALITFSVFGLFAVIFSWLMASIYLTSSVALGDLCMSPGQLMEREAPAPLQREILEYYTSCDQISQNPFFVVVRKATSAVDAVSYSMGSMTKIARQLYKPPQLHPKLDMLSKEVKLAISLIQSLATKLDCTQIHNQYMSALHAVCEMALFGLTFMLAASIGAGFLFAILVWLDSHTWIYIRKNEGKIPRENMSKESENSLPVIDSDIRLTESALNEEPLNGLEIHQDPSPSTSIPGTLGLTGDPEGARDSPLNLIRESSVSAENLFARSGSPDDDSVQEVTWVISKLDIFKSTSSSRKKSEEITDFYKTKLYKCGVMLKKPQQIFHRENPADGGFRGLHGAGPGGICDRGGVSQYATLNRKFRTLEHPPSARRSDIGEYHCGVVSVIDNQVVPDVSQYATVNRKFRTIDHSLAARRAENGMAGRRNEPGNSYTLGNRSKSRMDGPGQYSTLSKKCKTLESSDFY